MARLRQHQTDPRTHDWLVSDAGGWSISSGPVPRYELPALEDLDLSVVRDAVLERLGVTGAELRSALALDHRKAYRVGTGVVVGLSSETLAHLGVAPGDSLECTLMPDGSVVHRRAAEVDVSAVRARIKAVGDSTPGLSARFLARLFYVPKSTVQRILRGES